MNYSIIKSNLEINQNEIILIGMRNLEHMSIQRYLWNYENSPYGKAHNWLAKEENSGRFVGSGTLFPRRIFLNGEPVFAAVAGDFAIDAEHRAYGPALRMQKVIQSSIEDNGFGFIYGVPNSASEAIFLRIGYIEVGRLERYVKVLKSEYKLKEYVKVPLVANLLSKIIDFKMRVLSKESIFKKSANYEAGGLVKFDERFDDLWKRALNQFKVIGERSSKFLDWRYMQCPQFDFYIFALSDNKKNITGYIVYYIREKICYVVDMLFSDTTECLDNLIYEFIRHARDKGICSISASYMGNSTIVNKLKEWGFNLRDDYFKVVVYYPRISTFSNFISDKENWYFFAGDNDIW